jgi:hypothetical protein
MTDERFELSNDETNDAIDITSYAMAGRDGGSMARMSPGAVLVSSFVRSFTWGEVRRGHRD